MANWEPKQESTPLTAGRELWKGVRKGFQAFAETVSTIINTVLLALVYLFAVGLTAIVARIVGKHFFDLTVDKRWKSYYRDLNLSTRPTEEYYRQF